ncbi:MAG: FliM/FliN family flagellar motor switch protein [Candidatus Lindowbacteria bacterium]|nr:FliM/FliN family flagellar motor switch protein [Candidatus Lindowbacteria bacterium]
MSDMNDQKDDSKDRKLPAQGAIIDATAHRRPRIHGLEAEGAKPEEGLDFLRNVTLKVNVVLAETRMSLGDVLALETDSVVQLDKPSGDPVDIYVEDQKMGKGEVIVLQEKLRVRVLEVTPPVPGARGTQVNEPEGE